jgi:hypothetical protein
MPKKEQAHIAQDEEEASLMLMTATLIRPEAGQTEVGGPIAPARDQRSDRQGSLLQELRLRVPWRR